MGRQKKYPGYFFTEWLWVFFSIISVLLYLLFLLCCVISIYFYILYHMYLFLISLLWSGVKQVHNGFKTILKSHLYFHPPTFLLKYGSEEKGSSFCKCSIFLGFIKYYVKKTKRFVILCSDKSSERNLSCFFDMRKTQEDGAFTEGRTLFLRSVF